MKTLFITDYRITCIHLQSCDQLRAQSSRYKYRYTRNRLYTYNETCIYVRLRTKSEMNNCLPRERFFKGHYSMENILEDTKRGELKEFRDCHEVICRVKEYPRKLYSHTYLTDLFPFPLPFNQTL